MKVAIICGGIPGPTFIENLITGLANNGIIVLIVGKVKGETKYNSKSIRNCGTGGRLKNLLLFHKYLILLALFKFSSLHIILNESRNKNRSFYQFIIKYGPLIWHEPDIIHIQWAKEIRDWIWLKFFFDMKLVLSLRGTHINSSPLADYELADIYKEYFPKIDKVHCVSNAIKKVAEKYGVRSSYAKIIYSGVDLKKIELRKTQKVNKNKIRILSVGRNHWKKGFNYAIIAASILKKEKFDFKYEIVSQGSEENIFLINKLNLKDEVVFSNKLCHSDVIKKMRKSNILLLPSVEEGIANVALESMAVGLPVISTNCGGMPEVIQDGKNGILIKSREPFEIVESIKKIITMSSNEIYELILNARNTIESNHDLEKTIREFLELYQDCISKKINTN